MRPSTENYHHAALFSTSRKGIYVPDPAVDCLIYWLWDQIVLINHVQILCTDKVGHSFMSTKTFKNKLQNKHIKRGQYGTPKIARRRVSFLRTSSGHKQRVDIMPFLKQCSVPPRPTSLGASLPYTNVMCHNYVYLQCSQYLFPPVNLNLRITWKDILVIQRRTQKKKFFVQSRLFRLPRMRQMACRTFLPEVKVCMRKNSDRTSICPDHPRRRSVCLGFRYHSPKEDVPI